MDRKKLICYFCGRSGHISSECWDKRDGKAPHPEGKHAKDLAEKNKKKGKEITKKIKNPRRNNQRINQIENEENQEEEESPEVPNMTDSFILQMNQDFNFLPCPLDDF